MTFSFYDGTNIGIFIDGGKQLTEEDIDVSLVKDFLRGIGSKIEDQDLENPQKLYENMRLVRTLGDKQLQGKLIKRFVPRNIALLFFYPTPHKFFSGAKTDIAIYDRSKNFLYNKIEEGPIDQQISNTLEYILSETKGKDECFDFVPYPKAALREAVVNALYHRGYEPEHADPVKVRIYPDLIEITSYPGPHPSLKKDHFMEDSEIPPVKTRNRRVGEFLIQRKLAEDKGTGVRSIFRSMKSNGNITPVFQFDEEYFQVRLPGHPKFMVRDLLEVVDNFCAKGEKEKAVEQVLKFMKHHPTVRSSSLLTKLLELHDRDKNHPNVQPYMEHISQREENRLRLKEDLREWCLSPDIPKGVAIIEELVANEADSDDLKKATEVAVKLYQENFDNKPNGKELKLEACQKAYQLFQAMGPVAKSDAFISYQSGCCKHSLYLLTTRKERTRIKLELVSLLREAEECISDAISLTNPQNTKHLARQNRMLGYIHCELLSVNRSTEENVIKYYDLARKYDTDIHINEIRVPPQFRNRYKEAHQWTDQWTW